MHAIPRPAGDNATVDQATVYRVIRETKAALETASLNAFHTNPGCGWDGRTPQNRVDSTMAMSLMRGSTSAWPQARVVPWESNLHP
jgi:hypothetical protein